MRRLILVLLPIFLTACSVVDVIHSIDGTAPSQQAGQLTEVNYGTYRDGAQVAQTTGVPTEIGLSFGYRVKVAEGVQQPVKAKVVTVTPGLIDPSSSQTRTEYATEVTFEPGQTYDVFFTFSQPWEMATGKWELRVEPAEGPPLSRTFDIYNPGGQ